MTDTVNVPRDDDSRSFSDSLLPEAMIWAGIEVQEQVDRDNANYVAGETIDWDQGMIAVAIYRAMLASAPKAEPVSDPYKLVTAADLIAWVDSHPHPTSWIATGVDIRAIVEKMTAQPLSNPQQLPEAQKVEQEHVGTVAIVPRKPTEKEISEIRYNINRKRSDGSDLTEHDVREVLENYFYNVGQPHPAPASDELLEALEQKLKEYEWRIAGSVIEEALDLIAKHKGPQS